MADSFQSLNIYDAPGVLLGQAAGGVMSWSSVRDSVFGPDRLSPEERKTLADRMGAPEGGFGRAVVEAALNPWVWGLFLMGPVGAKALREGKSFFAMKGNAFTKKAAPLLAPLLSPLEVLEGTGFQQVASGVAAHRERMILEDAAILANPTKKLVNKLDSLLPESERGGWSKHGTLDPLTYKEGSAKRSLLEEFLQLGGGVVADTDGDTVRRVAEVRYKVEVKDPGKDWRSLLEDPLLRDSQEVMKSQLDAVRKMQRKARRQALDEWKELVAQGADVGRSREDYLNERVPQVRVSDVRVVREKEVTEAAMTLGVTARFAERFGPEGLGYLKAQDYSRRRLFAQHLGDLGHFDKTTKWTPDGDVEAVGEWKTNPEKVKRVWADLIREYGEHPVTGSVGKGTTSLQGMQAMTELVGLRNVEHLQVAGKNVGGEEAVSALLGLLEDTVSPTNWAKPFYAPRNTYSVVKVGGRTPEVELDAIERVVTDNHPAMAGKMSKRIAPLTEKELEYDPEWLARFGEGSLTEAGKKHLRKMESKASFLYRKEGKAVLGYRPDPSLMHARYVDNVSVSAAYAHPADGASLQADASGTKGLAPGAAVRKTTTSDTKRRKVTDPLPEGATYGDIAERIYRRLEAPGLQAYLRDTGLPSVVGRAGPEYLAIYNARIASKAQAEWFVKTPFAAFIKKNGGQMGEGIIRKLEEHADFDTEGRGLDLGRGMAKWLYASHLWFNNSTVMLNLMQPLTLTATGARADDVAEAMALSLKQTGAYMTERVRRGKGMSDTEEMELIHKHFPLSKHGPEGRNLIGVRPNIQQMLDAHLHEGEGMLDRVGRAGMFLFEGTEFANRNTAALVMQKNYKRVVAQERGIRVQDVTDDMLFEKPHYVSDVERFNLQMSFGQKDVNTPSLFLKAPFNMPLARQFLTFPLRTLVGAAHTLPRAGEQGYFEGLLRTTVRGMGLSALVYEFGKHTVGADLSRGLYASSVAGVIGGGLSGDAGLIPLPPVLSVPFDLSRGVLGADYDMVAGALARAVPGGVAVQRAMGVMPQMDGLLGAVPGMFQKTYVDYKNPLPTGEVPVYKRDGSLVGYRSGSEIVARGLGVDMGQWGEQGKLDGYLVKQRTQVVGMRNEYMRALAGNEPAKADAIQQDFKRKFKGVPLTVTKEQMSRYLQSRQTSRTERVIRYVPPDVRWQYEAVIKGRTPPGGGNPVSEDKVAELIRRAHRPSEEEGRTAFLGFS